MKFPGRIVHIALAEQRIGCEDREGYLGKTIFDEQVSNGGIVPSFATGITNMERGFHAAEKFDKLFETVDSSSGLLLRSR